MASTARQRTASPRPGLKEDGSAIPEKANESKGRCLTATIWEKAEVVMSNGKKQGNVTRRKTDYYWIACFYLAAFVLGKKAWPDYDFTTPKDRLNLVHSINLPFGFEDPLDKDLWKVFVAYFAQASVAISTIVCLCFAIMYSINPGKTYTSVIWRQVRVVAVNCALLLPLADAIPTYLCYRGWFKVFVNEPPYDAGSYAMLYHLRDILLWIWGFELTWYTQHRAMHDNKFLWKLGHEYHHQWRKPEHMIGITNFAFDHIVELWVTMSSSYIPMLLFPIHVWAFRAIGFTYMILAVFVHWDAFPFRYHINHHYCVIKNYGSHVPFFDMLFGTYQWGSFFPKGEDEKYPGFRPAASKKKET